MTYMGRFGRRGNVALSCFIAGAVCCLSFASSTPAVGAEKPSKPKRAETPPNLRVDKDAPARKSVIAAIKTFKAFERSKNKKSKKKGPSLSAVISKLENAAGRASKVPQLYYYMGIAYQHAEKYPRAKSRLERAIKLNPDFFEAYTEYGDVFQWLKDYDGAIKQYDKALKLDAKYDVALERKGNALIRLGRFKEAKKLVRRAQKINKTLAREMTLLRLKMSLKGPKWSDTFVYETDNFIVKSSVSGKLAEEVGDAAERIRRAYIKVFPKTKRPDRKFLILVHRNHKQYARNGGPQQAGGHYEPDFRILQLFKYPKTTQTIAVLNHEAFHQFIHDYIEQTPQWFNEGVAEYFGAFEYVPQQQRVVSRPQKGRLRWIKFAIRNKRCPAPGELMLMTRAEMYDPQMAGIYYAQAWSLVYFMLEGKKPGYRKTLARYFKALLAGKNIEEAYKQTFGKINMKKFENDWKSFTISIPGGDD